MYLYVLDFIFFLCVSIFGGGGGGVAHTLINTIGNKDLHRD